MLLHLPEELLLQVAQCLSAQDVLKLLILHRSLTPLGNSELLWTSLLKRDSRQDDVVSTYSTVQEKKRAYLVYAHMCLLEKVQWCPVRQTSSPSPREGHLMCLLGTRIVLTGGFCDDNRVHVLSTASDDQQQQQRWNVVYPRSRTNFVYGASLTPLNDGIRAVRFGGFSVGGYSGETNQVCVLTVTDDDQASWETIDTQGPPPTARAYHTATLVQGRYLVIIGGMITRGSILREAILDTLTWTWLDKNVTLRLTQPSGRHGHSVVLDSKRNRLVLFGGGSGSDLLRSGIDNSEVWQLDMKSNNSTTSSLAESLPWTWSKIYKNAHGEETGELPSTTGKASGLSPAECLVLGRCHVAAQVSVDMVLLAFGSGRPTTNGVLAYNLVTDKFHRPAVSGPLPVPRFTAAAAVVDKQGWLVIHGGYTTQVDGTRGDVVVLDLAPGIRRTFPSLRTVPDGDRDVLTYRQIGDGDARHGRRRQMDNDIGGMLMQLSATSRHERREAANRMLVDVINGGGMGGRAALILSMVANGTAVIGGEDDDEDDDEDVSNNDDE